MSCRSEGASVRECPVSRLPGAGPRRLELAFAPNQLAVVYFLSSWIVIGVISAYDAYLVKVFRPVVLSLERNPVCATLIHWDPHQLSYFFVAKGAGTMLVLAVLIALYFWKRRLALRVITGVTVFQVALLLYLNLAPY